MNDDERSATPQVGRLRARYARRVTADHVGERVSVRHLVDDPERGPVPSDTVGRLGALDDQLLLVVDRRAQLHVIEVTRVIASRVIPPHPRLAAEPTVGTRERPLERAAARVLLLDDDGDVLLLAHQPADDRTVWTAPGGGLRPEEDHARAAARELDEELGLAPVLGPWVWHRRVRFSFRGLWLEQDEHWFVARMPRVTVEDPPGDPGTGQARWWSLDELRSTDDELAPRALPEHLAALLRDGPPVEPVDVGR